MPQLLLELFCEEIPARMQAKAEADLGAALEKSLKDSGLTFGGVETLSGPRRLAVIIDGLSLKSEDVREERKGPKVGAPEKAVEGFLRGAGLSSIDQAEVRSDPKKSDFYVAVIETPGRMASDIIAEAVPAIVRGFHWPKSMRWGSGDLRWVRPLQRIVCVLDGKVVPFDVDGLASGDQTEGHRVHGRGPFTVTNGDIYKDTLNGEGHVMLSRDARREKILANATKVCADAGLELVDDRGLLEEVTGLAEWPVVLLGEMDPAFLDLPDEVIQLSMRVHQKYFAVRDPKTGALAPNFVVVANISAKDGGEKIAQGNSRVLSARLNDARFFWDNDLETPLEKMGEKLATIDFKKELGTIADKIERVAALAKALAPKVCADPALAERAARLCKSDLVSEMVYEFPELQGVMGRYYAFEWGRKLNAAFPETTMSSGIRKNADEAAGFRMSDADASASGKAGSLEGLSDAEITKVADAIRDHYKPQGPSDAVPTDPVSVAVALADKLDTLVGFWAIDEKPTSSKDPFALRRAALGVVRILLENGVSLSLLEALELSCCSHIGSFGLRGQTAEPFKETAAEYDPATEGGPGNSWYHPPIKKWIDWDGELESKATLIGDCQLGFPSDEESEEYYTVAREAYENLLLPRLGALDSIMGHFIFSGDEESDSFSLVPVRATLKKDLQGCFFWLDDLLSFFADRLKQYMKDQGKRHDLIDAVFALGEDDLMLISKRVDALSSFLEKEDGANLLAGYKRAANILRAEEKKDDTTYSDAIQESLLIEKEEKDLFAALKSGENETAAALDAEDFEAAMAAMSNLRGPIDAFFDRVIVNADDEDVRKNRLNLLSTIRSVLGRVADFSKIEG